MNQKKLITILATITIIAILSVSLFFTQFSVATATTYNADNMTVAGVLDSDNYVLYPFEKTSMKIGFSKYGEMIDTNTNVGLEYGDVDPFAAPPGSSVITSLPKKYWSQGWLINITYTHKTLGRRNVWAMATFADMVDYGGPWLRVDWGTNDYDDGPTEGEPGLWGYESPGDPGYPIGGAAVLMNGGRKTNGTVITQPITVLYDGPRRFVALLNSTIYDYTGTPPDEPLVRLLITIVFDKVKKEVILFKDVKSVISFKILTGFMNIQLSNRGQVDLGTTTEGFESYAHFYTEGIGIYDVSEEGQSTVYDSEYAMVTTETPCKIYNDTATENTNSSRLYDTSKTWPISDLTGYKVAILSGTGAGQVRTIASNSTTYLVVTPVWTTTPTTGSQYAIYDPTICKTADGRFPQDSDATYDLVQAINPDAEYVWSAAFWPSLSDWSIWGWAQQFRSLGALDPHYIDMPFEEEVPYYIGEWDFELGHSTSANCMFRGVTAYSVVDQHDADDANMGITHTNVIDSEVQYYLNETFNPYDLYDAVHKQESRWAYKHTLTSTSTEVTAGYLNLDRTAAGLNDMIYYIPKYVLNPTPNSPNYGPERVAVGGTTTGSGGWTGYFIRRDAGDYAARASTWVNKFTGGSDYVHSKNWALKLIEGAGLANQEFLKVTPIAGTPTTAAPLTLKLKDLVDFGVWYKTTGARTPFFEIDLYSTQDPMAAGAVWHALDSTQGTPPSVGWEYYTRPLDASVGGWGWVIDYAGNEQTWEDVVALYGEFYVQSIGVVGNPSQTLYIDDLTVAYTMGASGVGYKRVYNMEEDKMVPSTWDAYCSFAERVEVNGVMYPRLGVGDAYSDATWPTGVTKGYTIVFYEQYNATGKAGVPFEQISKIYFWDKSLAAAWKLSSGQVVKVLYSTIEENEKGRYEWIVVGKNAATIDSAATAYVAQAFDSTKDIKVLMAGMDMNETTYGPYAPFVMGRATTGTRTDYVDCLGRSYLRDDWCHTIPISSSNMIFMAGPRANLGTEYFNDFTNAFFAESEWVVNNTLSHANKILGLSCWNKTIYGNGYAVISVYKDLNGTIGLLFSGYQGQDFYYACKWFWDYPAGILAPDGTRVYSGIEYLQHENLGVTDIVLKITYPTADPTHPTVSIVEHLGTISEKPQHDP